MQQINGNDFKKAYGIAQFADMFSISRDSTKRAIKRGELRTITLGGRRLIPASEVERIAREGFGTPRTVIVAGVEAQ
jgi:excisionase family DNA binding protein